MLAFLRWFEKFRELEAQSDMLHSQIAVKSAGINRLAAERDDIQKQCDVLTRELAMERGKRISAEAIASERGETIKRMDAEVKRANDSRDEAISRRMDNSDKVTGLLLKRLTPDEVDLNPESARATFAKVAELMPDRRVNRSVDIDQKTRNEVMEIVNRRKQAEQKATIVEAG